MDNNQDSSDDSQYRVHSRTEVISLLKTLMQRNQPLTLIINHGADSIMTLILDINESNNTITIDAAKSSTLNERIEQSNHLHFEALYNNIRLTFLVKQARAGSNEDQATLIVPIPESLVRLQRRDSFRVITPLTKPLRCAFKIEHADGTLEVITANLNNISIGGVGLIDESLALDVSKGIIYKGCKLELSETSSIIVNLEMRDSQQIKLPNGKVINRFGCSFVGLTNQTEAMIQRTITQLERNQNARASGRL